MLVSSEDRIVLQLYFIDLLDSKADAANSYAVPISVPLKRSVLSLEGNV